MKYVARKKHKQACALCDDEIRPGDRVVRWCWQNPEWEGPDSGSKYGGITYVHATCEVIGHREGLLDESIRSFEETDDERYNGLENESPTPLSDEADAALAAERLKVRPTVVCICGSTRFIEAIAALQWHFEKAGSITFAPLYLPPQIGTGPHLAEAAGVKERIDELFKRKIDRSDQVVVCDIGGYIGESTRSEIEYATARGLLVRYLSKDETIRRALVGDFDLEELERLVRA